MGESYSYLGRGGGVEVEDGLFKRADFHVVDTTRFSGVGNIVKFNTHTILIRRHIRRSDVIESYIIVVSVKRYFLIHPVSVFVGLV